MSNGADKSVSGTTKAFEFASSLDEGRQRFLARAVEHALQHGRRTPADFIRHFPPSAVMRGLEHNAELRALILVSTTGIRERIAVKKSWQDAAADLQLAFDEGETSAEAIVKLFTADNRVRYLDAQKLWTFLSDGEFWRIASDDKTRAAVVQEHVAYLLDSALEEEVIDHHDVVAAITVHELTNCLPREELGALIGRALENAENGRMFTEADLLATAPARTIVQYVPLSHIWEALVRPRIARRHGYEAAEELPARHVSDVAPENLPAWSIPPEPAPRQNAPMAEPAHDEVTRVTPKAKGRSKPAADAKIRGSAPEKQPAMRAPTPPEIREEVLADLSDNDDDIELLDDEAKAG